LENVFEVPARFWINLQSIYDEDLSRFSQKELLKSENNKEKEILKKFSYSDFVMKKIFSPFNKSVDKILFLRKFFRVSDLSKIEKVCGVDFRKSDCNHEISKENILAWLRY
jgi:HTH-type transcriptional regulator / antitoxin HigA